MDVCGPSSHTGAVPDRDALDRRAATGLAVTVVTWASAFPAIRVAVEDLGAAGCAQLTHLQQEALA